MSNPQGGILNSFPSIWSDPKDPIIKVRAVVGLFRVTQTNIVTAAQHQATAQDFV